MKKTTDNERLRAVRYSYLLRTGVIHERMRNRGKKKGRKGGSSVDEKSTVKEVWEYVNAKIAEGINIVVTKKNDVVVILPEVLKLSDQYYEETTKYFEVIRYLATYAKPKLQGYRKALVLKSVNFNSVRQISSSAALRLTAELSRWEDCILDRLTPNVENWDPDIVARFDDLGFFDLFKRPPSLEGLERQTNVRFVKYIKGNCANKDYSNLKKEIRQLVGEEVRKWTFLHSGLDEAITNVGHHAYPDGCEVNEVHRNWYLTGGYDEKSRLMKIVFFDQGVGIPRSLPASKVRERVLSYLSDLGYSEFEKRRDETLLKAAVEVSRTRTGEEDRGKGLADMLEFIKQRGQGYLSILSQHGLYKYTLDERGERTKSIRFDNPTTGTLIIWKVKL